MTVDWFVAGCTVPAPTVPVSHGASSVMHQAFYSEDSSSAAVLFVFLQSATCRVTRKANIAGTLPWGIYQGQCAAMVIKVLRNGVGGSLTVTVVKTLNYSRAWGK